MSDRRRILAWAFYDWANSAFAVVVMGAFFPVLLRSYWSAESQDAVSTFKMGVANSTAIVIVALLAPILGAVTVSVIVLFLMGGLLLMWVDTSRTASAHHGLEGQGVQS